MLELNKIVEHCHWCWYQLMSISYMIESSSLYLSSLYVSNSLELSFTNIGGLCFNFVDCKSFLESNSPDILVVWDKPGWLIDSGNFSVRGYLPLIQKESTTHMHGLRVYVKEGFPYAQDLSLENLLHSVSSLSSINHLLHLCAWLFILFHRT